MKLVITIDTEEDNWGNFISKGYTLENLKRLPVLQDLFDKFNARPTYLITYPVAADEQSIKTLKGIQEEGRGEIGTHCHPWNTPPFDEEINAFNSMLCNLPPDLQYRKLEHLHRIIEKNLGTTPISFRSGRWGYSKDVAKNIRKLGYKIDTSISSFMDWSEYHGPDFTDISPRPFLFSDEDPFRESQNGDILEVPATVGFLQKNFILCNCIVGKIEKKPLSYLRIKGLLYRLGLLNKVWLSPEISDGETMIKLAQNMKKKKIPFINLVFHSTALKAGLSPFVKTAADEKEFLGRIRKFLSFTEAEGIESIKLVDALSEIKE